MRSSRCAGPTSSSPTSRSTPDSSRRRSPTASTSTRTTATPTSGLSFPELNLRTYVRGDEGSGVYFYNLDADDRIGVSLARRLFRLPYYRVAMQVDDRGDGALRFRSRRTHRGAPPARFDATYRPTEGPNREFATVRGST